MLTINQSTRIENLTVYISGKYVSFCYEVNGEVKVDTVHKSELQEGDSLFAVNLYLIKKYGTDA